MNKDGKIYIGFSSKVNSGMLLSHGSGGELTDGDVILVDSDCDLSLCTSRWCNIKPDGTISFVVGKNHSMTKIKIIYGK